MSSLPLVFNVAAPDAVPLGTSAQGLLGSGPRFSVIIVSGALAISGTSSAEPHSLWDERYEYAHEPTSGGLTVETTTDASEASGKNTGPAIAELRRLSGLTWDQLGQLFQVSRRSVHFWASGKATNAANLKRLMRTLEVIRAADRGDAHANRAAMFECTDGMSPFDLLVAQRYDDARAMLGQGRGRRKVAGTPLSAAARSARRPPPPEELVDAKQDSLPREVGQGRAARTVRNKRRGTGR